MTRRETGEIMDILAAAYQGFYSKIDKRDMVTVAKLWARMFAEDPFDLVRDAVEDIIANNETHYPPSIGEVKAVVRRLSAERRPVRRTHLEIRNGEEVAVYDD